MRFIHCADLHLDSKLETNLDSSKAKTRRKELITAFENVVSFAVQNSVRAVIVAGDLFDHNKVTERTVLTIAQIIESAKEIDFLVLAGNHDNVNPFNTLKELPENLKFFSDSWKEYRYENVSIFGIEQNSNNANIVYSSLEAQSDRFNIAVMHGDVNNEIKLASLKNKNIDYLALGHIHTNCLERLDSRGMYAYCGCLESRGFDESGEKGFYLIDTESKEYRFVIDKNRRKVLRLYTDISGLSTYSEIKSAVQKVLLENGARECDMVKIILTGQSDANANKDAMQLLSYLKNSFYFAKLEDKSKTIINVDDYKNDVSLKGEFVRLLLSSDTPEEEIEAIFKCAISAIEGEEIEL